MTTAAVENVGFIKPIPLGAFVDVTAEVVGVGRTSMKVRVRAVMDGGEDEDDILAAEGVFVYVTLNKQDISGRAVKRP